jgi:ribosomal protein L32
MLCPQCRSAECLRSHRAGMVDFLFTLIGSRPWRCKTCERRFYASHVALSYAHLAHCPRCGNFDLDHISRDRVEKGTLLFAKRLLRFPAYRCDPCRERFFSALPFRRIRSSTAVVPEPHIPVPVQTEN